MLVFSEDSEGRRTDVRSSFYFRQKQVVVVPRDIRGHRSVPQLARYEALASSHFGVELRTDDGRVECVRVKEGHESAFDRMTIDLISLS